MHGQFPMEKWKPHDPAPSTGQHQLKPEANALVGFFYNFDLCCRESGQTEVQGLYKPPMPWLYIAQPQRLSLSTERNQEI